MVPVGEMSSVLTFPKLNGNNYYAWADNMMSALQAQLLWLIIDGQRPSPSKPSANPSVNATTNKPLSFSSDDYKEWICLQNMHIQWLKSDLAAMGLMRGAIEFGQREHVQSATSLKEMWDRLCQLHVTQRQDTNIHYYFEELYLKKWDERTSMLDHIGSFLNLKRCIVEAGHKLDNILVVHAILHSLPHTNIWDVVRYNLLNKGKGLTLDILSAELISVHNYSEHDHLANEKENMLKSEQMALFTKLSSSSTRSEKRPWRGKSNDKPPIRPSSTKCHICGKEGHWAPKCHSKPFRRNDSYHPEGSANLAVERSISLGEREVGRMLMASSDTILSTKVLLDCGATSHMFMCRKSFTNYIKSSNKFITIGRRNQVPVAGQGSINFTALLPNGCFSIILYNVLYIPHLGTNLVSLSALYHQGVSVRSLDNSLVLSKDGEELFQASLTNSAGALYYIQCVPLASNTTYLTKNSGNMRLQCHQHYRIGHSNPHAIDPKCHQYIKNLEVSKKNISRSVNDALTNNITSSPTDIPTTIDSPLLVTTPLSNIPKDSALSSAVIPPENSFPSLPKHSNCDRKLQNHLALSMVNNVTTDTINAALIAKANKSKTHHEVSHSPHSKQWELAVQFSHDYVNCDSLSLSMAYLKGKRAWAARLYYSRNFFASPWQISQDIFKISN